MAHPEQSNDSYPSRARGQSPLATLLLLLLVRSGPALQAKTGPQRW